MEGCQELGGEYFFIRFQQPLLFADEEEKIIPEKGKTLDKWEKIYYSKAV
jgi:hypothetical protein